MNTRRNNNGQQRPGQFTGSAVNKTQRLFHALQDTPLSTHPKTYSARPNEISMLYPNVSPLPAEFQLDRTDKLIEEIASSSNEEIASSSKKNLAPDMSLSRWSDIFHSPVRDTSDILGDINPNDTYTVNEFDLMVQPIDTNIFTPMHAKIKNYKDNQNLSFNLTAHKNATTACPKEIRDFSNVIESGSISNQVLLDDMHSGADILDLSSAAERFDRTYTKSPHDHDSLLLVSEARPRIRAFLGEDKLLVSGSASVELGSYRHFMIEDRSISQTVTEEEEEELSPIEKAAIEYPELRLELSNDEFEDWIDGEMSCAEDEYFKASNDYHHKMLNILEIKTKNLDLIHRLHLDIEQRKSKVLSGIENVRDKSLSRLNELNLPTQAEIETEPDT